MTILRIFIESEDLSSVNWQSVSNPEEIETGSGSIGETLGVNFDQLELYLSPTLATIIPVELGAISDRKINEDFLLSLAEESLAEDIENCKPILLRLSEGSSYIAILEREFYQKLLTALADHVKQVKFIQPFPYLLTYQDPAWTVYLNGNNKFIRTSTYEYFLLDDNYPLPDLLAQMLENYEQDFLNIYCENSSIVELISQKFNLECKVHNELHYGVTHWNFYNEKSRRFNFKLKPDSLLQLKRLGKTVAICGCIFLAYWFLNLGYLLYKQASLRGQIQNDLKGIVSISNSKYTANLLPQVDDKLTDLEHQKGLYAPSDMLSLFDVFIRTVPNVGSNTIIGVQYNSNQLDIFLNNQFDTSQFSNYQTILITRRIAASITDYKTYQAAQSSANSSGSSGGIADDNSSTNSQNSAQASLQDAAWVVSLQIISRLDATNVQKTK